MMMRKLYLFFRDWIFPPRITDNEMRDIGKLTRDTTAEANRLADEFERIEKKAADEHEDPLAVLIREVNRASFRRAIR